MSFGHIRHKKNMFSGWSSPRPTSFTQFNREKVNVQPESWTANSMKSDASEKDIEEYRTSVVKWMIACRGKVAFWEV